MARLGNGTSDKIVSAAIGTPTAYSYHFWYRNANTPTSTTRQPFSVGLAGNTNDTGFSWGHSSAAFRQAAFHCRATNTYVAAKLTSTLSANTWYAIGATYDGTNLRAYLNGTKEATTGCVGIVGTVPTVKALCGSAGGSFDDGTIAEAAYWSVALTDAQMKAVAGGGPFMSPANLVLYWPLFGDSPEPDYSGAQRSGTVTGTTIKNHPPVAAGLA